MPKKSASTHNATPEKIISKIFTPDRIQKLKEYKVKPIKYRVQLKESEGEMCAEICFCTAMSIRI